MKKYITKFFKKHEKEIKSIATTFVTTFLVTVGVFFQSVDADSINQSLIMAGLISAVRSAFKAVITMWVK